MIIFLYGLDNYRSREKLREIIESYKKIHRSGLNLRVYQKENLDFQDFKNQFQQSSMFQEKKLLVLEDILSDQKFREEFLKNKDIFLKTKEVIVFLEERKISSQNKLLKFLKKEAKCQEFKLLKDQDLRNWIEKKGINIGSRALTKLTEAVGSDLWRMKNELTKLVNYKKGRIEEDDIDLLVRSNSEGEIFQTIDAIAQRNKKLALSLLEGHLQKGDSPFYLLTMINYQFRNLILAKLNSLTGFHPFVARKSRQLSRNFSLKELKKIHRSIFQTDLNIKTGRVKPEEGLKILIAGL